MFTTQNMQRCFGAGILLATFMAGSSFAANQADFNSPEQAVEALNKAVESDDQAEIARLIGPLDSSGEMVQDKTDRERFIQKYSEMHRLVKQLDGTTVLYIGAENWPFPVPLVSNDGKWRFDVDAGGQEVLFRHIGENETTAMETCRSIAQAIGHPEFRTNDKVLNDYVQKVVGATDPPAEAFHGYQFRLLRRSNGAVVVAYPSEYGSTGVMTFAVTPSGTVSEKDLGPETVKLAQSMTRYKPGRTWHVAEQ
jgi:hypothetical protein